MAERPTHRKNRDGRCRKGCTACAAERNSSTTRRWFDIITNTPLRHRLSPDAPACRECGKAHPHPTAVIVDKDGDLWSHNNHGSICIETAVEMAKEWDREEPDAAPHTAYGLFPLAELKNAPAESAGEGGSGHGDV